jgi:hypothetical protein
MDHPDRPLCGNCTAAQVEMQLHGKFGFVILTAQFPTGQSCRAHCGRLYFHGCPASSAALPRLSTAFGDARAGSLQKTSCHQHEQIQIFSVLTMVPDSFSPLPMKKEPLPRSFPERRGRRHAGGRGAKPSGIG